MRKVLLAFAVLAFGIMASVQAADTVTTTMVCKNPDGTTISRHGWDPTTGSYMWGTSYGPDFWRLLSGSVYNSKIEFRGWMDTQIKYTDAASQMWIANFFLPEPEPGYIKNYNLTMNKFCNRITFSYSGVSYRVTDVVWGVKDQALNATTLKNNSNNIIAPKDSSGRFSFPVTLRGAGTNYWLYFIFSDGDIMPVSVADLDDGAYDLPLNFGTTRSADTSKIRIDAFKSAKAEINLTDETVFDRTSMKVEKKAETK